MWCDHCKHDVKAVVSPLGGQARCGECGTELGQISNRNPDGSATHEDDSKRAPNARDLLARWAREEAIPPVQLPTSSTSQYRPQPVPEINPRPVVPSETPPPQAVRWDSAHTSGPTPVSLPHQVSAAPPTFPVPHYPLSTPQYHGTPIQPSALPPQIIAPHFAQPVYPHPQAMYDAIVPPGPGAMPHYYIHSPEPRIPAPHFGIQVIPRVSAPVATGIAAQAIAFVGVLGLTLGTFILLYTHFLAAEQDALLAPGWVVAAVSQLVLLLGVVMLVSAGLSQTSQEVAWRVQSIGERLQRIETSSSAAGGSEAS